MTLWGFIDAHPIMAVTAFIIIASLVERSIIVRGNR